METYVSAPIVDKQGDMVPTKTIKEAMEFYMRYGVYSYRHEEMPIGLPLAYKVKEGKVKIKIGIHNKIAMHDKVWKEIKDYGPSGASSIRGEATDQEKVCYSENDCHNRINELLSGLSLGLVIIQPTQRQRSQTYQWLNPRVFR